VAVVKHLASPLLRGLRGLRGLFERYFVRKKKVLFSGKFDFTLSDAAKQSPQTPQTPQTPTPDHEGSYCFNV
jgi:hypothetical protein